MSIPFKKLTLVLMISTLSACGSDSNPASDSGTVLPATGSSNADNQTPSTVDTSTPPVTQVPVTPTVTEPPVVVEPVVEVPVIEEPVVEVPVVEVPVVEDPVAEEPVVEEPTVDYSVIGGATKNGEEIFVINGDDPFNATLESAVAIAPADGMPSVPQNLRVELIGNDWVEFNWTPSADNGEVVAYNIYRDDEATPTYVLEKDMVHPNAGVTAELSKFWRSTSFIDCNRTRFLDRVFFCNGGPNGEPARGPEIGSAHTYQVTAVDNDGNESAKSNSLAVQLFDKTGSPVDRFFDPYYAPGDGFPFDTNLASPSNFTDRFDLVFSEDFNGQELDSSKWNTRLTWGPDVVINGEKQYFVDIMETPDFGYDPFKFNGSTLTIEAVKTPPEMLEAANNQRYMSGALSTYDKFGMTYGYVESRMRLSGVYGSLSTLYLFHRWAGDQAPEIDIIEYLGYNQYGDEDAFQTYHYADSQYDSNGLTHSSPTMNNKNESGALYSEAFHTFGVLWEPGLIVWYIDGIEIKRLVGPQVARQEMNLVTYLVTGSGWTQAPDEYQLSDEAVEMNDTVVNLPFQLEADNPIELEIDYIRVYQRPEFSQE